MMLSDRCIFKSREIGNLSNPLCGHNAVNAKSEIWNPKSMKCVKSFVFVAIMQYIH
jgi:hypothetical protein